MYRIILYMTETMYNRSNYPAPHLRAYKITYRVDSCIMGLNTDRGSAMVRGYTDDIRTMTVHAIDISHALSVFWSNTTAEYLNTTITEVTLLAEKGDSDNESV